LPQQQVGGWLPAAGGAEPQVTVTSQPQSGSGQR